MEPVPSLYVYTKPMGDGNLSVAEGVVVRTRDGIEQAEVVETPCRRYCRKSPPHRIRRPLLCPVLP
ncbi:hypothetical protein NXW09_29390 [Bacteroides ovatus]|nr:hypothetical protein [Bacteroides ovatus]